MLVSRGLYWVNSKSVVDISKLQFEQDDLLHISNAFVLPIITEYTKDTITSVTVGDSNSIKSPVYSAEKTKTSSELPIFNALLELQSPIKNLAPEYSIDSTTESVGYFELDGKLYTGYLTPLTTING